METKWDTEIFITSFSSKAKFSQNALFLLQCICTLVRVGWTAEVKHFVPSQEQPSCLGHMRLHREWPGGGLFWPIHGTLHGQREDVLGQTKHTSDAASSPVSGLTCFKSSLDGFCVFFCSCVVVFATCLVTMELWRNTRAVRWIVIKHRASWYVSLLSVYSQTKTVC